MDIALAVKVKEAFIAARGRHYAALTAQIAEVARGIVGIGNTDRKALAVGLFAVELDGTAEVEHRGRGVTFFEDRVTLIGGIALGDRAEVERNALGERDLRAVDPDGGVSGAAGQLGIMQPYLIAEVPRQSVPADCNKFTGYPSNMKATIGSLTGYTEVDIVYLKGIEATQAELDELESVLKGGFII